MGDQTGKPLHEMSPEERKLEIAELQAKIVSSKTMNVSQREMENGRQARLNGEPIESCPFQSGLTKYWWEMGYNSVTTDDEKLQT
jgi:ribosome modulation factor